MSEQNKISECKSCGDEIVWMKTKQGKNIPVDLPEPDYPGPDKDTREEVLSATVFNRERMTTHFETCPQSAQHRRPRSSSSAPTPAPAGDANLNAKRLNTAIAALEDIVKKPADGLRAQEIAKAAISQIRAIR